MKSESGLTGDAAALVASSANTAGDVEMDDEEDDDEDDDDDMEEIS